LVREVGFNTIGVLTRVNAIKYVKNDPKQGVITVENFEKMPMPIILDVKKVGR
jgi:hypothetical protein